MIQDFFHILLWVTTIILVISGIDDLFIDVMYWINRRKYKRSLPKFSEMENKPEKPIAIMIGAWREYKVIGRTLTLALNKLKYSNYRIFVGVYPNDLKTVKVVRDIAKKDKRVILCLNINDGPTTKADNLNNLYSCLKEYEKIHGLFEIVLIHDSEDFIHPLSLKLFNYFISHKGYYAIQIPVIPIKSKFGRFFHRTYCDAFAELHSKDLIVRQTLGSFVPFAGTGMGFNRNAFLYLETQDDKYSYKKTGTKTESEEGSNEHTRKSLYELFAEIDKENPADTKENYSFNFRYNQKPGKSKERNIIHRKVPVKQILLFCIALVLIGIIISNYKNVSSGSITEAESNNFENQNTEIIADRNDEELPKELSKVSTSLYDNDLKTVYFQDTSGTFSIQESAWSDLKKANNRAAFVSKVIGDYNISVSQFSNNGITIFRVILQGYESLESAKLKAREIRDLLKH